MPTRPEPLLVGHCFSEAGQPSVNIDSSLDAPPTSTNGLIDVARCCTQSDVGERMTLEHCTEKLVMLESSESERRAAAAAFRAAPHVPPRVVALTTRSSEASVSSFRGRPLRVLAVTLNCGDKPLKAVELRAFLHTAASRATATETCWRTSWR
jgi:AmiR/NasT family two-component response regulator